MNAMRLSAAFENRPMIAVTSCRPAPERHRTDERLPRLMPALIIQKPSRAFAKRKNHILSGGTTWI